ncbi:MAG: hypothetical protein KME42_23605 [Tildeniella nuda ZEHNDER 1965/U140]|nr:hypothetical protein [Tildeniella nuda ZEHNDER 1965/U140]
MPMLDAWLKPPRSASYHFTKLWLHRQDSFSGQRSAVSGQRSAVSGQRSAVSGQQQKRICRAIL